jgi:hypothetical protein
MIRRIALVTVVLFAGAEAARAQAPLSAADLAKAIDRHIEAKWEKVQPVPELDDADFLRRVSLDLIGRVPRVSELRAFLDDPAPDKRQRIVEQMLSENPFVVNMGTYWKAALIPSNNNQNFQFQNPAFKNWIEDKVRQNVPYDKLAREILAGSIGNDRDMQLAQFGQLNPGSNANIGAQTFYAAAENKPENIAANISRVFLGVRLECAQCHDHPFSSWSRKQFWELAAFFPVVQQQRQVVGGLVLPTAVKSRHIKIPNTETIVAARFMDGKEPPWKAGVDSRVTLADWVVAKENPFFTRMAVNRLWSHFFGLGLADPIDDEPTEENPISHPELLDELTKQFIANNYDVKYLMRAFAQTRVYQRGSTQSDASQADPRLWARMPVRGLSGEQLYDSLVVAVGLRPTPQAGPRQQFVFGGPRTEFVSRFAGQDRRTEKQTSILQALMMMNGRFIADATDLATGSTLGAVAEATFMTPAQKIETLYLAALGRMPRPEETERMESYVGRGGARNNAGSAYADVFWVLLNSSEFALNR